LPYISPSPNHSNIQLSFGYRRHRPQRINTSSNEETMASGMTSNIQQTMGQMGQYAERGLKQLVPSEMEHTVDEGQAILGRYLNMPFGFSMEQEIRKARNICKNLKDFPAYLDGSLVSSQIKQADAVVFLTNARAGIFMTGHVGSGLVVARNTDGSWSAPSAVFYLGSGMGLQGGADVTDYVIILKRQAVDSFAGNNQLVLGGDVGATFWMGRHGTAELHIGKRTGMAMGWAASKGFFAGAAATAGYLCTRSGINKKFYGREVDPADLLHGKISKPRAAKPLYDALNDLP
jgi:lipid-binding SYLF domain-containing protein